jgi:hypothetical protein
MIFNEQSKAKRFSYAYITKKGYNSWQGWRRQQSLQSDEECSFVNLKDYDLAVQQKVYHHYQGQAVFSFSMLDQEFDWELLVANGDHFFGGYKNARIFFTDCYISKVNFNKMFSDTDEIEGMLGNALMDAGKMNPFELEQAILQGGTAKFFNNESPEEYVISTLVEVVVGRGWLESKPIRYITITGNEWTNCWVFPKSLVSLIDNAGLEKENNND